MTDTPHQATFEGTISVALCTYNGQAHLAEQLGTISAQSRQPLELVVCDDRSTDATFDMLEKFARQAAFPVHLRRNPERLGSTRNFDQAIRLCQGKYIALSDQDDRWHVEKLARLGALLDACPEASMVFSDATLIDDASRPTGGTAWQSFRFPKAIRTLFREDPARILMEREVVTGATMMFRSTLLDHFSSIPATWIHDGWITWMSVLWNKPLFTSEPLTEYRVHVAQQVGVGGALPVQRAAQTLRDQRKRYSDRAAAFVDLLAYSEAYRELDRFDAPLRRTIAFLEQRAQAPVGYGARARFLLQHVPKYLRLSGSTWRALLRDLLMSNPEPR